jgi:hypothetical protein
MKMEDSIIGTLINDLNEEDEVASVESGPRRSLFLRKQ